MKSRKTWIFPNFSKAIRFLFLPCFFLLFLTTEKVSPQMATPTDTEKVIEAYEKEKIARWKRNVGKRFLVVRTVRPVEFFKSLDDLQRGFVIQKEKEGFLITEVVQHPSGTMNFYHVLFDSGQLGYLGADGNYLEMKILEKSLIPLSKKDQPRKGTSRLKESSVKAMEMVKKHLIKMDPMTGGKISVESWMKELKNKKFPRLTWWYDVREISPSWLRVIQWSEGEEASLVIRIWRVDLVAQQVFPENQSAQRWYGISF